MANMSYCRFQNTFSDFDDCLDALRNYGSVSDALAQVNETEQRYVRRLIELAAQMAGEFGEQLEEIKKKEKQADLFK